MKLKKTSALMTRMTMSKTASLVLGLLLTAVFGGLSFIFPERAGHLEKILTAIVSLSCAYIGLQVVNNGVKGKCWNEQMYEAENKINQFHIEERGVE